MKKALLFLYFLLFMMILSGNILESTSLVQYSMYAVIPVLLAYYLVSRSGKPDRIAWFLILGLVCSWLGDWFIFNYKSLDIQYGFIVFAGVHVFYSFAFFLSRNKERSEDVGPVVYSRIVLLIMVGLAVIYILYPMLGDMMWLVLIYMSALIIMGIAALTRRGYTSQSSFVQGYSGSLLFIMSASMLGIHTLLDPIPYGGAVITGIYLLGQFLIVNGVVRHLPEKN